MAKFCINCGSPLDEGAIYCDNCGTRVEAPQKAQPAQPPAQQYAQPVQHAEQPAPYAQSAQPYNPQPVQPPYGYNGYPSQPEQKKSKAPLIIAIAAAAVVIIAAAVVLFIYPGVLTKPGDTGNTRDRSRSLATEAARPTVAATLPPTEAPTEAPTEPPTEAPTEPPTEAPAPLPYIDSIGKPSATDFTWISDAQSGNLGGSFLGNDDLVGKWKGEIIYDGVWELVYVTIDRDATITIEPYMINYGDGWEDEEGEEPYVFTGMFDISSVNGKGSYGSINLYTFLESHGTQYAVGTFSVKNSSSADVYMVRP